MDVTFTNVLQGARQYFQGIPSSSNASVRISSLPEPHCRIPSSRNQEVPPSEQFWPIHVNTSSRVQSRNDSPIRQPVPHISNSSNQFSQLQYSKEIVEQHRISQYKIPYDKNEASHDQQIQFRHSRLLHMEHGEQEQQSQQRYFLQQPQHQLHQTNSQQLYFQQQAKHHAQKPNYPYLSQHGAQQEYQFHRVHQADQTTSNSTSVYPQISQFHQTQEQMKSQFFQKASSNTHTPLKESVGYTVPSEKQTTTCYSSDYGELKNYAWQRTASIKKSVNNSVECYQIQNNMYSKNVSSDKERHCDTSYMNAMQTSLQSDIHSKSSALSHRYESSVPLPPISQIVNRTNRESIISSVNCRTREVAASQSGVISLKQNSENNSLSMVQRNVRSQPSLSQGNFELTHLHHQYSTVASPKICEGFENSNINNIYTSGNPNGISANRGPDINSPVNTDSRIHSSNHEQINTYARTYISNNITRKESPLDLSLRTVKTCADSTLNESDNDVGMKYTQNKSIALKSIKNYPQFDVELFEKNLTKKSSQLTNVTDARYDFKPNFNVTNQSPLPKYYPRGKDQTAFPNPVDTFSKQSFTNSVAYTQNRTNPAVIQTNSNNLAQPQRTSSKPHRNVSAVLTDQSASNISNIKKRSSNTTECAVFNKIPKVVDPWRKSIDLQIEERLSNYKQQQKKLADHSLETTNHSFEPTNHSFEPTNHSLEATNHYAITEERPEGSNFSQNFEMMNSLPCTVQDNRQFFNNTVTDSSTSPPSNIKVQNNRFFGADKRVLNILRSSLEIKGKKKMEQQKAHENCSSRFHTDKEPTDDKNLIISSEKIVMKPASLPDTVSNITNKNNSLQSGTSRTVDVIRLHSQNIRDPTESHDNFAEFLAARIRTKGELKQGGSSVSSYNTFADCPEADTIEKAKSDISTFTSESESLKVRHNIIHRKRVFSKTEEGIINNPIPPRSKSEIRSSSETSVFDFPDSDSECEGKESLETMRKCRKSKQDLLTDLKDESLVQPPCHLDDNFIKVCEDFVHQLKDGFKKKPKRKKFFDQKCLDEVDIVSAEISFDLGNCQNSINSTLGKEDHEFELDGQVSNDIQDDGEQQKEANNNTQEELHSNKSDTKLITSENIFKKDLETAMLETNVEASSTKIVTNVALEHEPKIKVEISDTVKSESCNKNDEFKTNVPITQLKKCNITLKNEYSKNPQNSLSAISIIRPSKKPLFGDQSYFYPGWEEGVYKYKKSLRIPPTLIQISRPPQFHRLSTSLPDLDPYPQSPMISSPNDNENTSKLTQSKSESLESDNDSDYNFNVFGKKTNYDSESSASVLSSPNSTKELSILDKLLEKYGRNRERKYRRNEFRQRKLDDGTKMSPSTSMDIKENLHTKKFVTNAVKSDPSVLGYGKTTINTLKEAFMKSPDRVEDVNNSLTTVILKPRTRKETRILKQRATIKEVFGDERPASAPPSTFLNDLNFKKTIFDEDNCLGQLVIKLEKRDDMIDKIMQKQKKLELDNGQHPANKHLPETIETTKIKTEPIECELECLDQVAFKKFSNEPFESHSVDEFDNAARGRKKNRSGKMRRKLSSGFDYIRKKKKIKKEIVKNYFPCRKEKFFINEKTPESIHDIHKEIKTWVLNKGIGETHLHRAARLGYTDVTAYCLEKLNSNPSPKDNAGYTPLHEACARGHLDIAKLLLMYGANPSESAQGGVRPLHEACENGYVEITRLLLAYGADPTLVTYSGLTPLALTNDEITKNFLKNHLNDIEGEPSSPWIAFGPASFFDPIDINGYNVLDNVPDAETVTVEEEIQFEVADRLLPNFYMLQNESRSDRWILLQDLSNLLKIKSKDALLKQIAQPSTSNYKTVFKEMKMTDFLEQAQCCQFLNSGEKINSRASKISLVKYTKKLRELLNIETVTITR